MVLAATIALNVYLFIQVPKGFFPQQDNGRMMGTIIGDQDTSFQSMNDILVQMVKTCRLVSTTFHLILAYLVTISSSLFLPIHVMH